jgi:hypothetical protein
MCRCAAAAAAAAAEGTSQGVLLTGVDDGE